MLTPTALPFTSSGILTIVLSVVLLAVSTIAVALRFWSRVLTKFSIGLDDWLVLASLFTYYVTVVISVLATKYGGLGHEETFVLEKAPQNVNYLLLMLFAYTWAYSVSSQLIKLTILAFYWRIFPTKFIRTSCVILSAVSGLFMVSMMVVNALQCRPTAYYWTQVGEATCIDLSGYYFAVSVINFIIDLCTLMLPLREVSRLHAPFWRRIGICGIFFLGSIVVLASLARIVFMRRWQLMGQDNMTWDLVPGWIMTVIEVAVGIIGACLPTLVPVYRKLRYGSLDARNTSSGKRIAYQLRRNGNRMTAENPGLSSRSSTGETKQSHECFSQNVPMLSFDSFETLGGPPDNSDLEQQADRISVSEYHDAEREVKVPGSSLSSFDVERHLDAAPDTYLCTARDDLDGINETQGHT